MAQEGAVMGTVYRSRVTQRKCHKTGRELRGRGGDSWVRVAGGDILSAGCCWIKSSVQAWVGLAGVKKSQKSGGGVDEWDMDEAIHGGFCAFKFEWYGKRRPIHDAYLS